MITTTETHARYWARRHAPSWARTKAERRAPHRDVLACVNAHAGVRPKPNELEASNTLNLIKLGVRNGRELADFVAYLAVSPHSNYKRRAYCQRWLGHIYQGRKQL